MRAIPGLLIEYLISGLAALLWLYPFLPNIIKGNNAGLVLLPLLYVVGMIVDFVAYWITLWPKIGIREFANRRKGVETSSTSLRKAYILLHSSDLWDEIEKRSSRDRIARGALINILPIMFVHNDLVSIQIGSMIFVVFCLIWTWFEYQSYVFEISARQAILEKNKNAQRHC